jgi:hypothetical protein
MHRLFIRAGFAVGLVIICFVSSFASPAMPYGTSQGESLMPRVEVLSSRLDEVHLWLTVEPSAIPSQIDLQQGVEGLWGAIIPEQTVLPRTTFFVAIANTGTPQVEIVSWNTISVPVSLVSLTNDMGVGQLVTLGEPGVLREARIVPVTIFPLQYQSGASEGEMLVSAEIIIHAGSDIGINPILNSRGRVSSSWIPVYKSVIVNWQNLDGLDSPGNPHILIIAPGYYTDELAEFVDWKEKAGYVVTVVREGDIGANPSAEELRNYIIAQYDTLVPTPDYVIFVGDGTQLEVKYRWTDDPSNIFIHAPSSYPGNYTDENYFAAIVGDDVFPDLFFGRWVVSTGDEVTKIVQRSIHHEKDPFNTGSNLDSARFAKASMTSDITELSQAQTKRYVRQMLLEKGFAQVDTLFGSMSPEPLMSWVREGRNFVNYRGSGWSQGWAGINFYYDQIPFLNNYWKLPIVTGIGCGVAKFDQPPCFGEMWMLEGTLQYPEGAVGFLGPCWNTHTRFNDVLDSTLYRSILDNDVLHLMPAFVSGKMMFWDVFQPFFSVDTNVYEVAATAVRQYLCLSDPSLQLYSRIPQRLSVHHPSGILFGDVDLVVNVPNLLSLDLDSVKVCAWIEPSNFVFGWATPVHENVILHLTIPPSSTGIWLTVTGDNVLTYQTEIPIGQMEELMVHNRLFLADTLVGNHNGILEPGESISWQEEGLNIGSEDAQGVTAILQCEDPRVTVTQSLSQFGDVSSLDSVVGSPLFEFSVSDTCQQADLLAFELIWNGTGAGPWVSNVFIPLSLPTIQLVGIEVTDLAGDVWDRGETAKVALWVRNTGQAPLLPAQYTLIVADPLVTLVDSVADGDGIQPGDTLYLGDVAFQMQASWMTPADHPVSLMIHVFSNQGTYTYNEDLAATTIVGVTEASDPFSDTQRLYWVYDMADIHYSECPVYDWIEIIPSVGGPGDTIGFNRSDQTQPVPVPFTYSYYGISFDTLSISTDGWVQPGSTTRTDHSNSSLPDPAWGPEGLMGVFWDNLWRVGGESGQIGYYYDAAGDRFIVEWYRIHHANDSVRTITVQLQLLNPATHPTPTGDATWLFLYDEVLGSSLALATIGIENPASSDGITFEYNGHYTQGATTIHNNSVLKFTTEPPVMVSVETRGGSIPTAFDLAQNYPNPFNPTTTIEFSLPRTSHVTISIYNLLGQRVAVLADGILPAGIHQVQWRGNDLFGNPVGTGIYIYRAETDFGSQTRKMLLLR